MDLDQLNRILELVRQHDLAEFELEHEGLRLKIRKAAHGSSGTAPAIAGSHPLVAEAQPTSSEPGRAAPSVPAFAPAGPMSTTPDGVELAVVKSPIVGTFYRSAEPEAASFVEIGSIVKKGQVLCIIEAMKLMNEIESETDGEIAAVYVENGKPVQFGERLFAVKVQ